VVRILPAAEPTTFLVAWPTADDPDARFLRGRQLLGYENVDLPLLSVSDRSICVVAPTGPPRSRDAEPFDADISYDSIEAAPDQGGQVTEEH
jgi:hypothetical protein